MVNPKEFTSLRKEFKALDTNGSGTIDVNDLKIAVRKCHADMPEEELVRILHEVDVNRTGVIHYHEFIAAVFPVEKYATTERLNSLF